MPSSSDKTILIVDDSENDVQLLLRSFKAVGVENPVQVVYSAEDAMCYLAGEGRFANRGLYPFPNLVLLDLKMPATDGFEVLRWARCRPDLRGLIIVVLTSSELLEDIRRAYTLGANSFLTKPLRTAELNDLVRSFHQYWVVVNRGLPD